MKKIIIFLLVAIVLSLTILNHSYPETSNIGSSQISNFPAWRQSKVQLKNCQAYLRGYPFVYRIVQSDCVKNQNIILFIFDVLILVGIFYVLWRITALVSELPHKKKFISRFLKFVLCLFIYLAGSLWTLLIYLLLIGRIDFVGFIILFILAVLFNRLSYSFYQKSINKENSKILSQIVARAIILFSVLILTNVFLFAALNIVSALSYILEDPQESFASITPLVDFFIILFYILWQLIINLFRKIVVKK